jgi:acyl dehydratase
MTKRFYEDFDVGDVFETRGRVLDEAVVAQWAALSGDFSQLLVGDRDDSRRPGAHDYVLFALASGLANGVWEEGARAALSVGFDFARSPRVGDTVYCRLEVREKQPSRTRRGGSVRFDVSVVDQLGETLQTGEMRLLFYPRGREAPDGDRAAGGGGRRPLIEGLA